MNDKKIDNKKMVGILFSLCWMVYFVTYIGRLNYSSAMPVMIQEGVLLKTQAGSISMVFFFCYGFGQLLNGFLGDKVSSRKMIFTGLFISALSNFLMGLMGKYEFMIVLWGINGYAQSMIWPPIIRIFSDRLEQEERMKCCIHITSTMALGTLASYFLSAMVLAVMDWQAVFTTAACVMCLTAFVWNYGYRKVERYADELGSKTEKQEAEKKQERRVQVPFYKVCMYSGLLFMVLPVIVHGVLKDGVTSWVPTYITEVFSVSPIFSIIVTMVLPVVNLTGAYAANFMNRKIFRNEMKTATFFFFVSVFALLLLWKWGNVHVVFTIMLLSIITSSMLAVNTLFVNVIPMYFNEIGRSSTVSGFLNSMAYLGSAVSTFTIGILVEKRGWSITVFSWLVITVLAAVICLMVRNRGLEYSLKANGSPHN